MHVTDPTDGQNTWTRMIRRKVAQWGITYAAGGWGFLQGLEYVSEAFGWPGQIRQVAILALLLGLPIVLVIAWYHGDRGEQRVGGAELTLITLLFVLGGGIFWLYQFRGDTPAAAPREAAAAIPTTGIADARPSIAVLPFDNRSDELKDVFFVDGIHDDILTQLTKVSALRVTSRASVERFRDTRLPMKDIADQLGVTKILEGGVQRAGERVRINVQLIDAATDAHLWAETYDRDLTAANIFMIQSEVAAAIAAALNTTLTPAEMGRVDSIPTQNLEAWEAYQLGKQRMAKRTSATLAEAEASFRKAIELDGKFAPAYAGLANATWLKSDYSGQPLKPAVARAEELLAEALRLDPNLPEALATLAKFDQDRRDFQRAEAGYRRAIQLNPSYATAYHWYSQLLFLQGREAEALESLQKAVTLDPLSPMLQITLGWALSDQGRFDRALPRFEKARDIDPSSPLPYAAIGAMHAYGFGRLDDAIPHLEKAIELDVGGYRNAVQLARIYLDLGDDAQAEHWLDRAMQDGTANTVRAYQHLYRGEHAQAVTFCRRSLEIDPRDNEAMAVLRDAEFRKDEARTARARYAAAFPELFTQPSPEIDFSTWNAAIDLAIVLQKTGEHERATQLLDRTEALIQTTSRMGPWGYGIADARIHALRGQKAAALVALRQAATAGWRGPYWRYYRDLDPNLDSIRNESEFKAVFATIERDMGRQRAVVTARAENAQVRVIGESDADRTPQRAVRAAAMLPLNSRRWDL